MPIISGGVGSTAAMRAEFDSGPLTTVPTGVQTALKWGFGYGDASLLDLTDPAAPVVVDAGIYAVTAWLAPNPSNQADTQIITELDVGVSAANDWSYVTSPNALSDHATVFYPLTASCRAASVIRFLLTQSSGSDRGYNLFAAVQRVA